VHYSRVFSTMLWTRVVMFFVVGLVIGGVVAGNLYLAYRLRPLLRPTSPEQHALDRYRMLLSGHIGWWIGIVGGLIGLFSGISGQGHWQTWLLFVNGGSFHVKDPQFGTDIGWYIFDYPFWRYLLGIGFATMTLSLIGTIAMHYIFGGVRLQGRGERITTAARAQITTLLAVFILLKAIAYVLDKHGLLLDHIASINSTGAGYADINALVPAKTILAWISVIAAVAVLVFSNAFIRNLVWPGMAIGLLVISAIAIGGIYPFVVQHFVVNPNLPSKELTYISRSIDATRTAFGLKNIQTTTYPADNQTPPQSLQTDTATVPNIRLLDPAVVADTYTQLQRARGFYDFGQKLDIDRYTTNGKTQDYVVGIREIDYNSPAGQSWNWQKRPHDLHTRVRFRRRTGQRDRLRWSAVLRLRRSRHRRVRLVGHLEPAVLRQYEPDSGAEAGHLLRRRNGFVRGCRSAGGLKAARIRRPAREQRGPIRDIQRQRRRLGGFLLAPAAVRLEVQGAELLDLGRLQRRFEGALQPRSA